MLRWVRDSRICGPRCLGNLGQQATDGLPGPVALVGQLIFRRQDASAFLPRLMVTWLVR